MSIYNDYQQNGLDVLFVLGEDTSGNPSNLNYAKSYATSHGIPPEKLYVDPSWQKLFGHLYVYPYQDGSMALPWNGIMDAVNFTYYWSDHGSTDSLESVLNALLN